MRCSKRFQDYLGNRNTSLLELTSIQYMLLCNI